MTTKQSFSTNKLALGTVQFGMDYGINNKQGQIPKTQVFQILNYVKSNGIDTLDTAYNYGESEKVIGAFIKQASQKDFKLISKLPDAQPNQLLKVFKQSLLNLNTKKLQGYLFHSFQSFLNHPENLEILKDLKNKGLINQIGFSLYYPSEAEYLIKNKVEFDLIQIPYNIFDQRFDKIINKLKKTGKEIHTRSVFLQGLMFKKPNELTGQFNSIKTKIEEINHLAEKLNLSISAICLNFALLNKNIDKVVIGVDNLNNLKENIHDLNFKESVEKIYPTLLKLKVTDEDIILPTNWKK